MSLNNWRLASSALVFQNARDAWRQLHRVFDNAPVEEFVHFTCMLDLDACDYDLDLLSESSDSSGSDFGAFLTDPADTSIEPWELWDNEGYTDADGDSQMTDAPIQEFGTLLDLDDLSEIFSQVDESDLQDQRSDASTLRALEALGNFTSIQIHQTADAEMLDVLEAKHTSSQSSQVNAVQAFVTSGEDSSDAAHVEHVEFAKDEEVGMVEHIEYANSGQAESKGVGGGYEGGDNDTDSQPKDPMEELRQELKDQRTDLDAYYEITRRQPPLDHEVTAPYIYWWYIHVCYTLRHSEDLQVKNATALKLESDRGIEASNRWKKASGRSRDQLSTVSPESDRIRAARLNGAQLLQATRAKLISQGRNVDCGEQRHSLGKSLTMEEYEKMENPEDVFPEAKGPQW
ncbi:hypothetical protein CKAH01_07570 [Colletotrichum kahawae]|uniref:Uncharacterized protein n=1 Tax=Colletotrichum kahawae TaxID=34407 RepID=A0AAD9Y666_COLKA|nr:hypothetical protein CKAH01_07570 [Colletotrichum kahawae]